MILATNNLEIKSKKILLIENNLGDVRLLKEILMEKNPKNFKLIHVNNLKDGMERLKKQDIELILLDLGLPDSIGINTFKQCYSQSHKIPIVVLTSLDDDMIAQSSIRAGAQDYLIKGQLDNNILRQTIHYAIERNQLLLELETIYNSIKIINKILRHDIMNYFTIIKGFLEIYQKDRDEDNLNIIFENITNGIDLIHKMRELEQILYLGKKLKLLDVRGTLNPILENYSNQHIKVNINGDSKVLADEALSSVFNNIIQNAIKHGKTKKIDINIERKNDYCEIKFIDYGIGISDEMIDIIFKKFENGFKFGEINDIGLGLYIVKSVIDRYKGTFSIEKNSPTGCIVIIKLVI